MIIEYPNKLLREKSKPIKSGDIFNPEIKELIKNMRDELEKAKGVGLAAVQVGRPLRIILVEMEGGYGVFINPAVTRRSWKKIAMEEGCLSIPEKTGYVKRSETVRIKAQNEDGKKIKFQATGLAAIIFQHEIDHLNGILFIDKLIKK